MSDHMRDVEEQRAKLREQLPDSNRAADEEDPLHEGNVAPPLGERPDEPERPD